MGLEGRLVCRSAGKLDRRIYHRFSLILKDTSIEEHELPPLAGSRSEDLSEEQEHLFKNLGELLLGSYDPNKDKSMKKIFASLGFEGRMPLIDACGKTQVLRHYLFDLHFTLMEKGEKEIVLNQRPFSQNDILDSLDIVYPPALKHDPRIRQKRYVDLQARMEAKAEGQVVRFYIRFNEEKALPVSWALRATDDRYDGISNTLRQQMGRFLFRTEKPFESLFRTLGGLQYLPKGLMPGDHAQALRDYVSALFWGMDRRGKQEVRTGSIVLSKGDAWEILDAICYPASRQRRA